MLSPWREERGRPSAITADKVGLIIQGVRAGMSVTGAAARAGVYKQTVSYWKTTGTKLDLDDELDRARLTDAERLYIVLARGVTLAQGEFEYEQVRKLQAEANGDWKVRAWILERRFPEAWGKKLELRAELFRPDRPKQDGRQVDAPSTQDRVRAVLESAEQQGLPDRPEESPAEQPSSQPDCAQVGHRLGAGICCINCGEYVASRPTLAAPPPAVALRWRIIDEDGRVQES